MSPCTDPPASREENDDHRAQGAEYEERFGYTAKTGAALAVFLCFAMSAAIFPDVPWRIPLLVLGIGGAVILILIMASGKVALRVDSDGVALGGSPLWRYDEGTLRVPWPEIAALVLFTQPLPGTVPMRYLGIERHAQLPPLPRAPSSWLARTASKALIPGVAPEVVAASRPINGWKLDRAQLATAVAHHAPHVPIYSPQ